MMQDRPPKTVKPGANFVPEKEKNHLSAMAVSTARDWDSETVAMASGLGPLRIAKSSIKYGTKVLPP